MVRKNLTFIDGDFKLRLDGVNNSPNQMSSFGGGPIVAGSCLCIVDD